MSSEPVAYDHQPMPRWETILRKVTLVGRRSCAR